MTDIEEFERELESAMEEVAGDSEVAEGAVDGFEGLETAREVVEENGIESTDYIEFQSLMDARGLSRDETREYWDELRSDGTIPSQAQEDDTPTLGPEDALDMLGDVDAEDVESMHLFVVEGCPHCETMKERMSDPIEQGVLNVQNITEDDEAASLAAEHGIDRAPVVAFETEDGFVTV